MPTRRFRESQPTTLFRGRELTRLMSMLVMLGVIYLLMVRARDAKTWRMFATATDEQMAADDDEAGVAPPIKPRAARAQAKSKQPDSEQSPADPVGEKTAQVEPNHEEPDQKKPNQEKSNQEAAAQATSEHVPAAPVTDPSKAAELADDAPPEPAEEDLWDLDEEEQLAARKEFQAVTDKTALSLDEMPSYWRLFKWQENQPAEMLIRRGKPISFSDLFQTPDKYRGKLVRMRLHVRRTVTHKAPPNKMGVEHLTEAYGFTEQSQSWLYCVVFENPPPGMPLGTSIFEDATFSGYFLKLYAYKDGEGKNRAAPLLIGKLSWAKGPSMRADQENETWWAWLIGGVLLLLFVLRWGTSLLPGRRKPVEALRSAPRPDYPAEDAMPIEEWLEQVETPEEPPRPEIKSEYATDKNGNGAGKFFAGGVDWSEDRER